MPAGAPEALSARAVVRLWQSLSCREGLVRVCVCVVCVCVCVCVRGRCALCVVAMRGGGCVLLCTCCVPVVRTDCPSGCV